MRANLALPDELTDGPNPGHQSHVGERSFRGGCYAKAARQNVMGTPWARRGLAPGPLRVQAPQHHTAPADSDADYLRRRYTHLKVICRWPSAAKQEGICGSPRDGSVAQLPSMLRALVNTLTHT